MSVTKSYNKHNGTYYAYRGRKATAPVFTADTVQKMKNSTAINSEIIAMSERMKTISDSYENLGKELADLNSDMNALLLRLESES